MVGRLQGFWQLPPSEKRELAGEMERVALGWEGLVRALGRTAQ